MSFSFRRTKRRDDVIVDRLTGAFNRRQLDADIAAGVDTTGLSTATLMIEVDQFAALSGKRGATKGDQILERVAWVIMATVRTTDVVYRHEASTFCVLLPATSDVDATIVADRIRGNVAKMPLLADSGVSVTVGVASGPSHDVRDAVDRARQALDEAMRSGTSRIVHGEYGSTGESAGGSSPTAVMTRADASADVDPSGGPGQGAASASSEVRPLVLDPNNPFDASLTPPAHLPFAPPAVASIEVLHTLRPPIVPPPAPTPTPTPPTVA